MSLATLTAAEDAPLFERQVARLLIVLYTCGEIVTSLLDGETRQIESRARLSRLDFWAREPGHLALALLHTYMMVPDRFAGREDVLRTALDRMITNEQVDHRRVGLRSAGVSKELDHYLSFLTSRALISDRPSFNRSGGHRIILEGTGIAFVQKILTECPAFGWYRDQCETIVTFGPILEELVAMPYLDGELSLAAAASQPLSKIIRERYARTFRA